MIINDKHLPAKLIVDLIIVNDKSSALIEVNVKHRMQGKQLERLRIEKVNTVCRDTAHIRIFVSQPTVS